MDVWLKPDIAHIESALEERFGGIVVEIEREGKEKRMKEEKEEKMCLFLIS